MRWDKAVAEGNRSVEVLLDILRPEDGLNVLSATLGATHFDGRRQELLQTGNGVFRRIEPVQATRVKESLLGNLDSVAALGEKVLVRRIIVPGSICDIVGSVHGRGDGGY